MWVMEWIQLTGKILHGNIYLWLVMKKSSVSRARRFTYFQILYNALESLARTHCLGRQIDVVQKFTTIQSFDTIDGEPMEFEWNIFPGFTTLQLWHKVQEFLSKLSVTPEKFPGRIIFMSMFNDISWGSKDNKKECESSAQLVSLYAKRFGAGRWSFLGPGS